MDRILLTVNYAQNRSSNQLVNYTLPTITGQDGIYQKPACKYSRIIVGNFYLTLLILRRRYLNGQVQ